MPEVDAMSEDSANVALMLDREIDKRVGLALVRLLAGSSDYEEHLMQSASTEAEELDIIRNSLVRNLLSAANTTTATNSSARHDVQELVKQALRTL